MTSNKRLNKDGIDIDEYVRIIGTLVRKKDTPELSTAKTILVPDVIYYDPIKDAYIQVKDHIIRNKYFVNIYRCDELEQKENEIREYNIKYLEVALHIYSNERYKVLTYPLSF
jgi:hypothetical protein